MNKKIRAGLILLILTIITGVAIPGVILGQEQEKTDERFKPFVGRWELDARASTKVEFSIIFAGDGTPEMKYTFGGKPMEVAWSFVLDGSTPVLRIEVAGGERVEMILKHSPSQGGILWGIGRRGGRDISPRFYPAK